MPDVPAKRKEESLEIECLVHRPAKRKEESNPKTSTTQQKLNKQKQA